MKLFLFLLAPALLLSNAHGQLPETFKTGPVFAEFGPAADIKGAMPIADGAVFRHAFDVSKKAEPEMANRAMESAARFVNMHVRAGAARENVTVALVIHGPATADAMKKKDAEADAPTARLIAALVEEGHRIIVCGQSAESQGFSSDDLLPGAEMALSAMTAHALLQQDGYTLNPF